MSTGPQDDFPGEASIPQAAGSLESVLCMDESRQRASRPSYRACILSITLAALSAACAWPQTQLATVSGTITDPSGAVAPGVSVSIVSQGTGLKRNVLTDTAGEYRFAGLPTGTYSLRLGKPGFQSQVREGVELTSAAEVVINAQLAIGDLSQQANVSANAAALDSTTSTVEGLVPGQSFADLPLNNRDLFSAVTLEPGVAPNPSSSPSLLSNGKSGQVAIDGIRASMTNFLIDGMDATDPVWGNSPAGASGFFLGLNELAEVRVLTQTFDAEYGGHGGAVIAMTTKSGSNQFHGSLWELYRGASLDAKNYFDLGANPIPQFVRNQFGAGIGGPLKRNRTFFFANYEGFCQVQASTAIATVPDALAHQGQLPSAGNPSACTNATPGGCAAIPMNPSIQPFLSVLPPSNGPDNGDGTGQLITANKGTTREDHGMVRIDHSFSNTHSLFARYTVDDAVLLWFRTSGRRRAPMRRDSRRFTWRGISMALFRTVRHSDTNGSMSCALVSTGQLPLPRSTIRIRVCLLL